MAHHTGEGAIKVPKITYFINGPQKQVIQNKTVILRGSKNWFQRTAKSQLKNTTRKQVTEMKL